MELFISWLTNQVVVDLKRHSTLLPETAIRIATNGYESTHAFKIGSSAWGVQFHPEYTESIMKAYVVNMNESLNKDKSGTDKPGLDIASIILQVRETPIAWKILNRFGKLVS